jgi:geranylgeranylglycerol-phosphate geranylgeranyltransferase
MLRYIKAFIRLIKVEDQIGNSLAFMTGYIYASGFIAGESLPYALTSTCLGLMATNALNQCTDVDTDRINKPDRPIPAGLISIKEGYSIVTILYALTITLAALVNTTFFALTCIAVSLGIAYSVHPFRLKDRFVLSNLSIAIGYGTLNFLLGWLVTKPIHTVPIHMLVMLSAFDFFASISKDYRDIAGDIKHGSRTIPIVMGRARAVSFEFTAIYIVLALPLIYYVLAIESNHMILLLMPLGSILAYHAHRCVIIGKDVECYKSIMLLYILIRSIIIIAYMSIA